MSAPSGGDDADRPAAERPDRDDRPAAAGADRDDAPGPERGGDRLDRDDAATDPGALPAGGWYRGTIVRIYYGSESGTLRSDATGREYRFKMPFVEIRGAIPRIQGLREGMSVRFDVGWTSAGRRVTVIKLDE